MRITRLAVASASCSNLSSGWPTFSLVWIAGAKNPPPFSPAKKVLCDCCVLVVVTECFSAAVFISLIFTLLNGLWPGQLFNINFAGYAAPRRPGLPGFPLKYPIRTARFPGPNKTARLLYLLPFHPKDALHPRQFDHRKTPRKIGQQYVKSLLLYLQLPVIAAPPGELALPAQVSALQPFR